MRHGRKAFVAMVLIAVLFAAWQLVDRFALTPAPPAFRFTTVERGDVQAVVSAAGTLQAVTTVSVGTQASGQVSALYVDFNTEVKKGQLLARIDPTIAQQGVADAQANLERLKAQTAQASRDQDRNRDLQKEGLIPTSQSEQGAAALQVAQASEKSVESIVMGMLGGVFGLVLGVTSAEVLAHFTGWETVISPLVMIVAVGLSGAVGVFFGYYPARRAAALNPIDALRYE